MWICWQDPSQKTCRRTMARVRNDLLVALFPPTRTSVPNSASDGFWALSFYSMFFCGLRVSVCSDQLTLVPPLVPAVLFFRHSIERCYLFVIVSRIRAKLKLFIPQFQYTSEIISFCENIISEMKSVAPQWLHWLSSITRCTCTAEDSSQGRSSCTVLWRFSVAR